MPRGRDRRRADRRPDAQALRGRPRRPEDATCEEVKPAKPDAPRIAVIGAGPVRPDGGALPRRDGLPGHASSRREAKAGRHARAAIPEYRLPREALREGDRRAAEPEHRAASATRRSGATSRSTSCWARTATRPSTSRPARTRARKLDVPGEDAVEGRDPGHRVPQGLQPARRATWPRAASASSAAATRRWTRPAWRSGRRA